MLNEEELKGSGHCLLRFLWHLKGETERSKQYQSARPEFTADVSQKQVRYNINVPTYLVQPNQMEKMSQELATTSASCTHLEQLRVRLLLLGEAIILTCVVINTPITALPWVILATCNLCEALVKGQIVTYGVLKYILQFM
jgi:hypothetical protein